MRIVFNPDGTAQCLYSEDIDLRELGRLTVNRQSLVEFNDAKQKWEVWSADCRLLFEHESREACLEWERNNLG